MSRSDIETTLAQLAQDNPDTFGPELVLAAAQPESSPLHAFVFDKEVSEAAAEYYLDRAHQLIQSIHVTVVTKDETPRRVRAYVAIPGESQPYVFTPVAILMTDAPKLAAARTEAMRRVVQAQDAVDDLDAFSFGTSHQTKKAKLRLAEAAEALLSA